METENLKVIKKSNLKYEETGQKKEENDQQTWNLKLSLQTGNGPKNEETDWKKEETDQQTENFKLFLKTGNGPIKRGKGPKKRRNRSTNVPRILNFFWKPETD